jgi:hypothetical protein
MLGEGHILPWLVLVLEVGALPVPTEKRAPSRIVAAAYSLLTGDKSELAQIARRVDEERRRYRENKAKVIRGAPRWPQRGKATP